MPNYSSLTHGNSGLAFLGREYRLCQGKMELKRRIQQSRRMNEPRRGPVRVGLANWAAAQVLKFLGVRPPPREPAVRISSRLALLGNFKLVFDFTIWLEWT